MILSCGSEVLLEAIMRDMKKFTSAKILDAIKKEPESRREWMLGLFRFAGSMNGNNANYQFWQQDNHPVECIGHKMLEQKLDYLHDNPVRAGFIEKAEDWVVAAPVTSIVNKKVN